MSDERADPAPAPPSAGALLRQARQAQGMHIAVLAAAIKVPQRKLEALEADRFNELPDATFTRALAQTVCRTLKIDPTPVLALLPKPAGHQRLEHVAEGINAPFRERAAPDQGGDWGVSLSPAMWGALAVLGLAAAVYFLPPGFIKLPGVGGAASAPSVVLVPTPDPAASAAEGAPATPVAVAPPTEAASAASPDPAASAMVETVHSAPPAANDAASNAAAPPAAGVLVLRTSAESWIEVRDGRGQALISRVVMPGEAVGLDGAMPLKLTIGNAGATSVSFRGQAVDLAPRTRDNVARFELK